MSDEFIKLLTAHGADRSGEQALKAVRDGTPIPEASAAPLESSDDSSPSYRPSTPARHENPFDGITPPPTPKEYSGIPEQNIDQFADTDLDSVDFDDEPEPITSLEDDPFEEPPRSAAQELSAPSTGTVMDWMRGTSSPEDDLSGRGALYAADEDDYRSPSAASKIAGALPKIKAPSPSEIFEKHPTWKRPAMFAAGAASVGVVVTLLFGGSPASENQAVDTSVPVMAEEPDSGGVNGEPVVLKPKAVSANCPPGSSSATLAFTPRPEEAWVCGRANGIDGAIMNIQFVNTVVIKSITVVPGFAYVAPNGRDNWNEHRLVTKILWKLGNGRQFMQDIDPIRSGNTLTIPGDGIATTVASLKIMQTVRPSAVNTESLDGTNGEILAPTGVVGSNEMDPKVDESTAIPSIIIMGTEMQ